MSTKPSKSQITKALIFDTTIFAYLMLVAIVAVLMPTEDQLLDLGRNAIVTLICTGVAFVMAATFIKMNVATLGQNIFEPAHLKMARVPRPWYQTFWGWQFIISFVVTFVMGVYVTEFSFREVMDESGFLGAQRIFSALIDPEWSVLPTGVLAIIETIYIAFMATIIAIPIAFLLAFFAAKNIMSGSFFSLTIYTLLRTFLNITRSIEPLIWAIIFSVWVGIGPFAGMLALMLHSVSSLAKQYSELIESVDDGPIEGITATGANSIQVVWYAIVPQVVLPYIAFTIYRWDINVRMATVIGLVGGGGIGTLLIQYQGQALWNEVGTLALLIVIIVWTMDTASAYLREALK